MEQPEKNKGHIQNIQDGFGSAIPNDTAKPNPNPDLTLTLTHSTFGLAADTTGCHLTRHITGK